LSVRQLHRYLTTHVPYPSRITVADNATSRTFGNALEPEELRPLNRNQACLIVRETPGRMVNLLDWNDFVEYVDELRAARRPRGD
jgi:hypothetical protein